MLYDVEKQNDMVDTLQNRVSTICDTMVMLTSEGYIPNKAKVTKLNWSSILIDAFQNIIVLNEEQQHKIEILYNKVMAL